MMSKPGYCSAPAEMIGLSVPNALEPAQILNHWERGRTLGDGRLSRR
ncbi:hypothetical protein YT1_2014 [Rhodococcus ruber]|nr:hypothetical protein YT1_2014 [Rhodococcus ruber]